MKLGATITSERGKPVTKTANEYLMVKVNDENGNMIAYLIVDEEHTVFVDRENERYHKMERNNKTKNKAYPCDGDDISCPIHTSHEPNENLKHDKQLCNSCDDFGRGKESDKDCPICN